MRTSLEIVVEMFGSKQTRREPPFFSLVVMDEHQFVLCSIFCMILSFSNVLSSCCSHALMWTLHLCGASIDGLASRFRNMLAHAPNPRMAGPPTSTT